MLQALKSRFLRDKKGAGEDGGGDGKLKCTPLGVFGSYIPNGLFGKIRVVFLSDIHCKQYKVGFGIDVTQPNTLTQEEKLSTSIENLPDGDILIISGDFVETGLLEELTMFNLFLKGVAKKNKFKHIVFICGNHERTIDADFYEAEGWRYHKTRQDVQQCRNALFNDLPPNIHYLFDSCVVLEGLKIYGTPWVVGGETFSSATSPAHFRWAYSVTEDALIEKYAQIPEDVDILVTHMPPFGIGDGRRNYDKDYFDEQDRQCFVYDHEGSTSLSARLLRLPRLPLLHCYGHIHSGYGAYRASPLQLQWQLRTQVQIQKQMETQMHLRPDTLFVNAAICDEDYVPIQPAMVLDMSSVTKTPPILIAQHYSKEKLDTAVAMLVVIDGYSRLMLDDEGSGLAKTALKNTGRSYLKHVLSPLTSASSIRSTAKQKKQHQLRVAMVAAAENNLETELLRLFALHDLLPNMYSARHISRGAVEDSVDDFRSMQLVVPHLYIGSIYPSECKQTLQDMGITHICNCCQGWEPSFPDDFVYLTVPVEDIDTQDLSAFFIDFIAFVDVAINGNKEKHTIHATGTSTNQTTSPVQTTINTSASTTSIAPASCTDPSNNVYIHCQLGISRSAALVIAYLMFTLRVPYLAASALLKRARPFISPNQGFINQLLRFETSLRLEKLI